MSCRAAQDALIDLNDDRLDAATELRVHAHMETCADCRARAQAWATLLPSMRGLAPPPPTPLRARRMEVEIERRLAQPAAQPKPRLRRWPLYAAPAVAAAAVLIVLASARRHPTPIAPTPAPFAMMTSPSAPAGERLAPGSRVSLPAGRDAKLQLSALASLTLTGPATLVLGGDDKHVALTLEGGRLEAEVAHRQPGQTFTVAVPDGRIEVRGTRFIVVAGQGASSVRVEEGRVAVFDADNREWSVGAGESHSFAAPAPPAPNPPSASAAREVCEAPAVDCGRLTQSVRSAMRAADYARVQSLVEPALRPRPSCRPLACRTELGYLRAEALRASGHLDDAVAAYKALDRRDAPSATRQNALYAAALLERRSGNNSAARVDFERALAAAPGGALREEAMLGAMESADQSGDHAAAIVAARRYVDAFPNGLSAAAARRIVAAERGRAP
ncbi:MAG: transcriptional regulator, putative protein [bacterium]|nr:transcriptional regulator, putative protein [bacterium]